MCRRGWGTSLDLRMDEIGALRGVGTSPCTRSPMAGGRRRRGFAQQLGVRCTPMRLVSGDASIAIGSCARGNSLEYPGRSGPSKSVIGVLKSGSGAPSNSGRYEPILTRIGVIYPGSGEECRSLALSQLLSQLIMRASSCASASNRRLRLELIPMRSS